MTSQQDHSDVEIANVLRRADEEILYAQEIADELEYSKRNVRKRVKEIDSITVRGTDESVATVYTFDGLAPHRPLHTDLDRLHRFTVRWHPRLLRASFVGLVLPLLLFFTIGGPASLDVVETLVQNPVSSRLLLSLYLIGGLCALAWAITQIVAEVLFWRAA